MARPTKYKPEYCEQIIEFFNEGAIKMVKVKTKDLEGKTVTKEVEHVNDLPLFQAFAASIKVDHDTILNWTKKYPEFLGAYKRAKDLQMVHLVTNGMKGRYAAAFSIFTAKNIMGWRDKHEIIEEQQDLTINLRYRLDD